MSEHQYTRHLVDGRWDINNPLDVDSDGRRVTLAKRIETALPGKPFLVACDSALCVVTFGSDTLTAPEIATLDATVAAHQAAAGTPQRDERVIAAMAILPLEGAVGAGAAYSVVGGATMAPRRIRRDASYRLVVMGQHRTNAPSTPAQMRVRELTGESQSFVMPPQALDDTAGAWEDFRFLGAPLSLPQRSYECVARQNGATSVELRYVTLILLQE